MRDVESPRALLDRIAKVPRNETIPDQWEMHMEHAYTFEDALQRAFELKGKDAGVVVIPDGVSVIVRQ